MGRPRNEASSFICVHCYTEHKPKRGPLVILLSTNLKTRNGEAGRRPGNKQRTGEAWNTNCWSVEDVGYDKTNTTTKATAFSSNVRFFLYPGKPWYVCVCVCSGGRHVQDFQTFGFLMQEHIRTGGVGRVRACNYVRFKTGKNLPPILQIVTCPAHSQYALLLSTQFYF